MAFVLRSALKDLRRLRRDPLGLLLWVAIPLIVGLLLDLAFGGNGTVPRARLLVDDRDDSFVSALLVGAFGGGRLSQLVEVEAVDSADGRRRIEEGGASALLVIPAGFGPAVLAESPVELSLVTNPRSGCSPRSSARSCRRWSRPCSTRSGSCASHSGPCSGSRRLAPADSPTRPSPG